MELIAAIDLLGGQAVRLHQGDYDAVKVYSDDPVQLAEGFVAEGAGRLHIVDLEGARSGRPSAVELVRGIAERVSIPIQVGGGLRSAAVAEDWLRAGVTRVVLGTLAVREPEVVRDLCQRFPERIVVALDARGEKVATDGWLDESGRELVELARSAQRWGAAAILYTDIERDGTGRGPAIERTVALQADVQPVTVIASGGIGNLSDVVALRDAGIREAVCGRALYEGVFTLREALAVARKEPTC